MNALEAVALVLGEERGPLHYREITQRVLRRRLWTTEGKTPQNTIYSRLAEDIEQHGARSRFRRVGRGTFVLREIRRDRATDRAALETGGADDRRSLSAYVKNVVLPDLALLMRMKTSPPTGGRLSEPLVCHLMGWRWVRGHAGHDAEATEGRIQIKYSKEGFVSCSRNDLDRWEFLAWVHAPDRLPKFLILIPSAALNRAVFSAGSFKILSNLEVLRAAEGLKAWRFEVSRVEDLARQVRDPRPTRMNAREALAQLEADVRGAEWARRRSSRAPGRGDAVAPSIARQTIEPVGRGDLSRWNGRAFQARFRGREIAALVVDGLLVIAGVKRLGFRSLSAAGRHVTGHAMNGNTFWRPV